MLEERTRRYPAGGAGAWCRVIARARGVGAPGRRLVGRRPAGLVGAAQAAEGATPSIDWESCGAAGRVRHRSPCPSTTATRRDRRSTSRWRACTRATPPAASGRSCSTPVVPAPPGSRTCRSVVDSLPRELRDRFDLVSFDPRGVGDSGAVKCGADIDPLFDQSFSPVDAAERSALVAAFRTVVDACARDSGGAAPARLDRRHGTRPRSAARRDRRSQAHVRGRVVRHVPGNDLRHAVSRAGPGDRPRRRDRSGGRTAPRWRSDKRAGSSARSTTSSPTAPSSAAARSTTAASRARPTTRCVPRAARTAARRRCATRAARSTTPGSTPRSIEALYDGPRRLEGLRRGVGVAPKTATRRRCWRWPTASSGAPRAGWSTTRSMRSGPSRCLDGPLVGDVDAAERLQALATQAAPRGSAPSS